MSLATGTRLGPYEVLGLIGAGGMGEVYRARDTRLDRTVAIKILPPEVSADPDRRARFEREARVIASLAHPHICTLHDVGAADDVMFLVMEHLTGETLADRLRRGPLPVREALEVGAQIAEALDAAHKRGIIHRDLKPGNVMLTKAGVKLLDFGLAKPHPNEHPDVDATHTALAAPLTGRGVVLGTVEYMAPEQLEGRDADARSDLWAMGAILYEMIAGRRAFAGTSSASLITAILSAEPTPITTRQPLTPPALERLVRKCLAKDPDARWQNAADVADELRWITSSSGAASVGNGFTHGALPRRARWPMGVGLVSALGVGAIAGVALWRTLAPLPTPGVAHLAIPVSTWSLRLEQEGLAVSPDGQTVVFSAAEGSQGSRLYVRAIRGRDVTEVKPVALEATEGALFPFFSPDGQHIAFTASVDGELMQLSVSGGRSQKICNMAAHGGVWLADGRIVLGGGWQNPGIWVVPAAGGTPQALFRPEERRTVWYSFPDVLPGERDVLFTRYEDGRFSLGIWSPGRGERVLVEDAQQARYLPTGHLAYVYGDVLRLQAFDLDTLELRGPPRTLVEVAPQGPGRMTWAVSATGTLVYQPPYTAARRLVWKDRHGATTPLPLKARSYRSFSLSPDGRRLVAQFNEGARRRLWIGSVEGEPLTPLTQGPDDSFNTFTPDGMSVAFSRNVNGHYNLFRVAADSSGAMKPEPLAVSEEAQGQPEFHPTHNVVVFNYAERPEEIHIWEKVTDEAGPPRRLVSTPGVRREWFPRFSPDGRWLAYMSDASGTFEIYIQEYPTGRRLQVSSEGGMNPAWNPRGGELFYQTAQSLMSVRVADGRKGTPEQLFQDESGIRAGEPGFEVAPDGNRFLMVEPFESAKYPSQLYVVLNWLQELKAKSPAQ